MHGNAFSLHCRNVVRWLVALGFSTCVLVAQAVSHRYHVVTDTNYGSLSVQQFYGGSWSHHIDLTWYGPAYGEGAGYQVDATLTDNTSYTVRVAGGGLPGGGPLESKTFDSGTSFATTSWTVGPPATFKLKVSITNDTDFARVFMLDVGCDGLYEERFTMFPGEGVVREYDEDASEVVCVDSGRVGPDGEMIKDLPIAQIGTNAWQHTSGSPTNLPLAVMPGDASNVRPATKQNSIQFSAAAATNNTAATREGFSVLRSTMVESGKDQSELLRAIATNTARLNAKFGTTSNATQNVSWRIGLLSDTNSVNTARIAVTDALGDIETSVTIPGGTNFSWLLITIAGQELDLRPTSLPQDVQDLRHWVYHGFAWLLWFILGAAMLFRGKEHVATLMAAPSPNSFFVITEAISPFTLAVGAVLAGLFTTFFAVALTAAANAWTNTALAGGPYLADYPLISAGLSLAAYFVPLGDLFGTTIAYLAYEIVTSVSAFLGSLVLRALAN